MTCPTCKAAPIKVIFMGFPMKLCSEFYCSTIWGFWSFILDILPITTGGMWAFLGYEGRYLSALWYWMKNGCEEV